VSLRSRLLLALGAVVVAALLAADVATYSALRSFLFTQVDNSLTTSYEIAASQFGQPGPPGGHSPDNDGGGPKNVGSDTFSAVRSPSGTTQVLSYAYPGYSAEALSPKVPADISGLPACGPGSGSEGKYFNAPSAQSGGPEFRVRACALPNDYQLIVAVPLTGTYGTLHHLLLIEIAVSAGAILLSGAIGWWLVRLGLRPLRDIEHVAGAIADGHLDQRIPEGPPKTEVGRLSAALNVMLSRIQSAFAQRDATEAALRQSQGRLRRFVADASHELRTPVAAVSAYAELFERGAESRPEDLARVMKGIRGETARMGHLVEDLLLLARLDESRPIDRSPVDLVEVANDAVHAARAVGPEWPIQFLPGSPAVVMGDRSRLRQVLDNLLSNVRAHTPPGTTATITVHTDGDYAVCRIEDDGPGLTADEAERVFERFYRADPSRSRTSGGAGLGLSIVAAIVAAHGGRVAAAPAEGHGAVFTVQIPLDRPWPEPE
jgi:two-component system OmpR family sensor kinase